MWVCYLNFPYYSSDQIGLVRSRAKKNSLSTVLALRFRIAVAKDVPERDSFVDKIDDYSAVMY